MPTRMMSELLDQDHFGDFYMTEAVRPVPRHGVVPREGYRVGMHRDGLNGSAVPMLVAAVSRERLLDVFLEMLDELGPVVDLILETSHETPAGDHVDLNRDGIDLPVLASQLLDREELLLNDGCTGVAVMDELGTMEVQFDEHKLLVVYADDLAPFVAVLRKWGVDRDDQLRFVTEAEHLHSSRPHHKADFEQLCYELGIEEAAATVW